MNNSSYEEYMANVLGYNLRPQNTYQVPGNMYDMPQINTYDNTNLEEFYPDIYKLVYPMVQKACMKATGTINKEMIENMTNEIYVALGEETHTQNESTKNTGVTKTSGVTVSKTPETRQQNSMLKDLIRILIIRELLKRNRRPGMGRTPMYPTYI